MSESILITGASTGLGLASALHLAEKGFKVYAGVRNIEVDRPRLEEKARERGTRLNVVRLDMLDKESIEDSVDQILTECGSIYGLVNNGGIGLRGYFEDLTEEEIRQIFEVNVLGTMNVTRAVIPPMRQAQRGRIIVVTSVAGKIGSMGLTAYCSTKFAQEGFGESLAQELLPFGVHVTIVEPAIIKTERWSVNRGTAKNALNPESPYYQWFRTSEEAADKLLNSSPTRPIDVARTIEEVMTSERPKMRYVVGRRAGFALWLRRYLPGELFERLYFGTAIRRVTGAASAMPKESR